MLDAKMNAHTIGALLFNKKALALQKKPSSVQLFKILIDNMYVKYRVRCNNIALKYLVTFWK